MVTQSNTRQEKTVTQSNTRQEKMVTHYNLDPTTACNQTFYKQKNYCKYSVSDLLLMDNLGYDDSESEDEEERKSLCEESDGDIPDIERLLINPYR